MLISDAVWHNLSRIYELNATATATLRISRRINPASWLKGLTFFSEPNLVKYRPKGALGIMLSPFLTSGMHAYCISKLGLKINEQYFLSPSKSAA